MVQKFHISAGQPKPARCSHNQTHLHIHIYQKAPTKTTGPTHKQRQQQRWCKYRVRRRRGRRRDRKKLDFSWNLPQAKTRPLRVSFTPTTINYLTSGATILLISISPSWFCHVLTWKNQQLQHLLRNPSWDKLWFVPTVAQRLLVVSELDKKQQNTVSSLASSLNVYALIFFRRPGLTDSCTGDALNPDPNY